MAALRTTFEDVSPSHTVVVEAAVPLLHRGLLDVKGTRHVNVNQARALIAYAVWLQHYKSDEWFRDGKLSEAPWVLEYEQFIHILIGGAGTGKTTTLRCIDALVDFCHGPGSRRMSAPTNTAARKLPGDTVHALYKLPRGSMLSRSGRLSDCVLRAFRRSWAPTITQAVHEVSFLPQDMFYQINLRSQEAQRKPNLIMSDLVTFLCGDFLQLPPVEGRSLASPLTETGYEEVLEETGKPVRTSDAARRKERKEVKCRGGYALGRDECPSVTCLTLNMCTTKPLTDIAEGMRNNSMTDAAWLALEDRCVGYVRVGGVLQALPPCVPDPRQTHPLFRQTL